MNAETVTLAELAVTHAAATRVFMAHGLDFCCNGRRPLAEACRERDLDPGVILEEITVLAPSVGPGEDWAHRPAGELIDHIVSRYHRGLRSEIPELIGMAEKVERVHTDKPACPHGLAQVLRAMEQAVREHLDAEEERIFPVLRSGGGAGCAADIRAMEEDHDRHGQSLAELRRLTGDYTPPAEACTTWRALYLRLKTLQTELMEHIHLENNVLFPR